MVVLERVLVYESKKCPTVPNNPSLSSSPRLVALQRQRWMQYARHLQPQYRAYRLQGDQHDIDWTQRLLYAYTHYCRHLSEVAGEQLVRRYPL